MGKYIKLFDTHVEYETYINGSDAILPNVSICTTEGDVHYNPYVSETRVVTKYNVTSTSSPTVLRTSYEQNIFKSMEIDGIMLDELVTEYTFDTTGVHTVKYELYDETKLGGNSAPTFLNSNLIEVFIPSSVTSIGNDAFYGCSGLTSINIPSGVTSIGDYAFDNCTSLTSINIPSGVTSINKYTFTNCISLTSIDIPSGVTSIGMNAFGNCPSLTSVTIGSGVTSIGDGAFNGCTSLTSIVIPNSVTSIDTMAFFNCSGLTSITCNAATAPTIQSNTFRNVKTGGTLTVPRGSSGYNVWMKTSNYYLGKYNWTKVEQ